MGACPQAFAGQQKPERKPLPVPLLPAEEAWNVSLPSPPSAQGALDESRAYVPLQSGQIVALNRETGDNEWSIALASSWAPIVSDGVLYATGSDAIQAVRAASGRLFGDALDAELIAAPVTAGGHDLSPDQAGPVAGTAHVGRVGDLAARDRAASGSPTMTANATGVIVSSGSRLSRFAASDGHLEWERELAGVLGRPTPRAIVSSWARPTTTSTHSTPQRDVWPTDRVPEATWSEPRPTTNSCTSVSLDNLLRALRRGSGNQVWKRNLSTRTIAPPSTFGGIVLVTGNKPTLTTFDASTGAPIANFSVAADLQGVPLVDTTLEPFRVAIVVVTRDARAIGLRPTGMMFRELPLTPLQTLARPTAQPGTSRATELPNSNSQLPRSTNPRP